MDHRLYQADATGGRKLITSRLDSYGALFPIAIAAANNQLTVTAGYGAFHVSDPRPPRVAAFDWGGYSFQVEGDEGRGSFSVEHAQPRWERKTEFVNEFSHLFFYEHDILAHRAGWLRDDSWTASFNMGLGKAGDASRFLFHRLSLDHIQDRWVHVAVSEAGVSGTHSLTVVTPFVRPSLVSTLLRRATQGQEAPGYMPMLRLRTSHGQDGNPAHEWTHFPGNASGLPGPVTGFVMLAQGGLKAIPIAELSSWLATAAAPDQVFHRWTRVLARYGSFQRDLETVGVHDREAAVVPPADNLPVEVLHLTGLASPTHVLP